MGIWTTIVPKGLKKTGPKVGISLLDDSCTAPIELSVRDSHAS